MENTTTEEPKVEMPEVQEEIPSTVDNLSTAENQDEQPESQEESQQSKAEQNFRVLRQEKEKLEREHQEAMKRLAEYERMKSQQPAQPEEDLEINIGDDDLFEGKHYRKLQKQLRKQQEELQKYQQQVTLTTTESKLKHTFPDFDKVVTDDNIKLLRSKEPELADTIASNQDIYTQAVSAYKMIKQLGIYVEDNYEQDRKQAQTNARKPKPLASVSPQQGDSPLSKANAFANGLTPELKKQLWKEMQEASKKVN